MAERRPAGTFSDPTDEAPEGRLRVEYDITVVDGEAGRRLAILQSEVILDVLTWLHDHQHPEPASDATQAQL